jgi:dihydroorotate dehydrogenase electron transfer subunit
LLGSLNRHEQMRVTRIIALTDEATDMRGLHFIDMLCAQAKPGQYIMIWNPEAEEVPMSLASFGRDGTSSVLVREVGESTRALCGMKKGEKIGIRGPFGNGYVLQGKSPLIVSGGTGVVTLAPLAEEYVAKGIRPTFVLGARNEKLLPFRERLDNLLGKNLHISTDDGSFGYKGYASELAKELMGERRFDSVYTCGPELMMVSIFKETEKLGLNIQASLERYIKCAVGLCGSCAVGPYRVCKDGPVFTTEMLREVYDEFGKSRLDPSGQAIRVKH